MKSILKLIAVPGYAAENIYSLDGAELDSELKKVGFEPISAVDFERWRLIHYRDQDYSKKTWRDMALRVYGFLPDRFAPDSGVISRRDNSGNVCLPLFVAQTPVQRASARARGLFIER